MKDGRPTPQQPFVVDARIRQMIAGAVAEVDLAQIAMLRKLTVAERFAQMLSLMNFTEIAACDRLRLRNPALHELDALRIIRSGKMVQWLIKHRQQQQEE